MLRLLQALVLALTELGLAPAWSSLIVGGVVALIAFALIYKGMSDLKASNYFLSRGSSYQWSPMLDGELKVNPVVYGRRGGARTVNPARMRLCMDFEPVHFNRANRLYVDGHVAAAMK